MSTQKRVLFVGENPYGHTGNSHMVAALIEQLDTEKYIPSCFSGPDIDFSQTNVFTRPPIFIVPGGQNNDPWGTNNLLRLINRIDFDLLFMVGIDVWQYALAMEEFKKVKENRGFKWAWLFPYDLPTLRKDWVDWMNMIDYPIVYSQFGYDMLKNHVPKLIHFHPSLHNSEKFVNLNDSERRIVRQKYFPMAKDTTKIYGFVGVNQFRKDPQGLVEAFSYVHQSDPDSLLYMHTGLTTGVFNLPQAAIDLNLPRGSFISKDQNRLYRPEEMVDLFNCFDLLVNCTIQEGLSWTVVESLLCGTPALISYSTAHKDFQEYRKETTAVKYVHPTKTMFIPVFSKGGGTMYEGVRCDAISIAEEIQNFEFYSDVRNAARIVGTKWLSCVNNVNDLLENVFKEEEKRIVVRQQKKDRVLFVQHSAAGDVFMTTRCFKGLVERYGMKIDYMTQAKYRDILVGNPYIDILHDDYDPEIMKEYSTIINPHGDRILPGHWGRNANSILSDFYWKILNVDPDSFWIVEKEPEYIIETGDFVGELVSDLPDYFKAADVFLVHTTGGASYYRTYKYMAEVIAQFPKAVSIQLGGAEDYPANAMIDLRGHLSYRETAWVLGHIDFIFGVTVDSFMSHLVGAKGIDQVCLFGSGNANVVKPKQVQGTLICLSPDYVKICPGLGPCSGVVDCPVPCTSRHDPKTIVQHIKDAHFA